MSFLLFFSGSGGERMEALFLKHEGYFGAVGAFLSNRLNAAGKPSRSFVSAPKRFVCNLKFNYCSCMGCSYCCAGFVDVGVSPARRAAAAGGVSGGEAPLSPGDPVPSLRVLSSPLRSPSSSPPSDAVPAHRSLSAPEKQQAALEAEPEGEFTLGLQPYPAGSGPR